MNLFAKLFLVYVPFSILNAPIIEMIYGQENVGGLWMYRALAWFLIYFLFYLAIRRMAIEPEKIGKAIGWCAVISSIYAWLQFLNLDQFQFTRAPIDIGWQNKAPNISAMIGSGFYLSNWLCMCLPFCLSYMPWWASVLVVSVIIICHGLTAVVGMALIICLYFRKWFLWVAFIVIALLFLWTNHDNLAQKSDGRFEIWQEVFTAWHSPPVKVDTSAMPWDVKRRMLEINNQRTYALTGRGPGSFEFFFEKSHPGWNDPHNVYLRVLYEYGLIGEVLFLGVIVSVLWKNFRFYLIDKWVKTLYVAFCFCLFCGLTVPISPVEPLRFYSILIFSLLSI